MRTSGSQPTELYREYRRSRDPRVREAIVRMHVGMVRRLAARFAHRGEELDDLVQVAYCGLLHAIERFDPDRGTAFTTFATPTILGEIKRHFRDRRWNIRVPRSVQENYQRVGAVLDMLAQDLGRAPTTAEIADCAGLSERDVLNALQAGNSFRPLSIEDHSEGRQSPVDILLARQSSELQSFEDRQLATSLLTAVAERERRILRLRFNQGLTQREIAEREGVSQMHVSRLLARSLATLRMVAEASARDTTPPPQPCPVPS